MPLQIRPRGDYRLDHQYHFSAQMPCALTKSRMMMPPANSSRGTRTALVRYEMMKDIIWIEPVLTN